MDVAGRCRNRREHPLFDHQRPLWRLFDERKHGRGGVEFESSCIQGFSAKEPQPVNVAEVRMCQDHRMERRVPPNVQLFPQRSGRFHEVATAGFIGDAEANWVSNVFGTQIAATRALAARLRAPPILGRSKEGYLRHGGTKTVHNMRTFTRRSQTSPQSPSL